MKEKVSVKEWMGHLRVTANKYKYKKSNRRLKEQFMNGINDEKMIEIIKEFTVIKKTNKITLDHVIGWQKSRSTDCRKQYSTQLKKAKNLI